MWRCKDHHKSDLDIAWEDFFVNKALRKQEQAELFVLLENFD
jgi:hypothetical protein